MNVYLSTSLLDKIEWIRMLNGFGQMDKDTIIYPQYSHVTSVDLLPKAVNLHFCFLFFFS